MAVHCPELVCSSCSVNLCFHMANLYFQKLGQQCQAKQALCWDMLATCAIALAAVVDSAAVGRTLLFSRDRPIVQGIPRCLPAQIYKCC